MGVILLFVTLLFGGLRKQEEQTKKNQPSLEAAPTAPSSPGSEALQSSKEHDAQN